MRWGSGVAMSCGVGQRRSSDLALLWLWRRPAAVAPIGPLAWELPYAAGVALKKTNKKNPPQINVLPCAESLIHKYGHTFNNNNYFYI